MSLEAKPGTRPCGYTAVSRVLRLVGREAEAADLAARQLPDHPVARFDEAPVLFPDRGSLRCDLGGLCQQPLAGELAAEIVEKRAALGIDGIGIGLGRAMLPQLHIGMRLVGMKGGKRHAIACRWKWRTCGEAEADRFRSCGLAPVRAG